jgi:hypothetical protein
MCLRLLPIRVHKQDLAKVFSGEVKELKALEEFIIYKERCVEKIENV